VSPEDYEKLLDTIYDAALDPDLWPTAMAHIARVSNGTGGILIGQRVDLRQVLFSHNGGLDPECNAAFQDRHVDNVWSRTMVRKPAGQLVVSDEIIRLHDLQRTSFFADVLHPQNVAHNVMAPVAVRRGFLVAFNICRTARQGPPSGTDYARLRLLLRHVERSLALGHRFDAYGHLQRAEHDALDRLAMGVVLLDDTSTIVFCNRAAGALIGQAGPLRLVAGRLVSSHPNLTRRLDALVGDIQGGVPMAAMALPVHDESRTVLVVASSIRGRDRSRFYGIGHRPPAVLLFLIDTAADLDAEPIALREVFGLTPAEVRVALAVVREPGLAAAASALGMSTNTVKTHLARVFAKVGVRRQADLAQLVSALAAVRT
jgi:DNA-binding CsgD family transcriptional regulator